VECLLMSSLQLKARDPPTIPRTLLRGKRGHSLIRNSVMSEKGTNNPRSEVRSSNGCAELESSVAFLKSSVPKAANETPSSIRRFDRDRPSSFTKIEGLATFSRNVLKRSETFTIKLEAR
jgi:hypothetical protein